MPSGIHYGAAAATEWTNTSLTSKEMFFLLRYSIQTVVYLGMKLLGGFTNPWMQQIPSNGLSKASPQASSGLACRSGSSRR